MYSFAVAGFAIFFRQNNCLFIINYSSYFMNFVVFDGGLFVFKEYFLF